MSIKCGECGAGGLTRFEGESHTIAHNGLRTVKNLSGWRCAECDEVIFDAVSAKRYAAASDDLVLKAREQVSADLKRIRQRLGLSQKQAAMLSGGGHNAFSRYERGEAAPLAATVNLFRVLDKYPEILEDRELSLLGQSKPQGQSRRRKSRRLVLRKA